MTSTDLRPGTPNEVLDAVAWAVAGNKSLEIIGGGSKRLLGRSVEAPTHLLLQALSGIKLYEPEELVMTALAGTPMRDIELALRHCGQRLAFEPPDYNSLLGGLSSNATIGGVLACNLSGPCRFKAGAARDHFLGVKAKHTTI